MHVTLSSQVHWYRAGQAADWSDLVPGDRIEVHLQDFATDRGIVDCVAEDASVIWIQLERAGQRTLFHHLDGVRLSYA